MHQMHHTSYHLGDHPTFQAYLCPKEGTENGCDPQAPRSHLRIQVLALVRHRDDEPPRYYAA